MALLPSIASPITSNIADLFTKPIPVPAHQRHRFDSLIGDLHYSPPTTSVARPTVAVVGSPTASDSVPSLHPNLTLPIVFDTGASYSRTPFPSDFTLDFTLEVTQAPLRIDSVCF